jgi:hypothetical protein
VTLRQPGSRGQNDVASQTEDGKRVDFFKCGTTTVAVSRNEVITCIKGLGSRPAQDTVFPYFRYREAPWTKSCESTRYGVRIAARNTGWRHSLVPLEVTGEVLGHPSTASLVRPTG